MIQDRNKGVSQIQYNLLNLPDKIQFQTGHMTNSDYSADGVKCRVSYLTAIDNVSIPMGNLLPLSEDQIKSRLVTDYCDNVIYENGELTKVLIDGGYISFTGSTPHYHFYVKDHQSNNRIVLGEFGGVEESSHYYPFGGLFGESSQWTDTDPYKYNGKELDRMHGLNWYDYSARQYDPMGGGFPSMDTLCEKYYSISPYAYCMNNPIKYIDPDGSSTWVMQNSDGTYRVVGGDFDDEDKNIYTYTISEGRLVRGESIGESQLISSFYNSDENAWAIGAIIDPNDNSGSDFLSSFMDEQPTITDYMANATEGGKYDFKRSGFDNEIANRNTYFYRGMPVGTRNGKTVYSSARDIGNYTAGYIAGSLQIKWEWARKQFDKLESQQNNCISVEGYSTQNAEYDGWTKGLKDSFRYPWRTIKWTTRSIPGGIGWLIK